MATADFLVINNTIYKFSQYVQSSVASFSTQFNTDWGSVFGGTAPQLLATTAQPTQAVLIVPNGPVLYINPGGARTTTTDGVTTNTSTTISAADAYFNQSDVGAAITGTNIPGSTTIVSVSSLTTAVISNAATGTASNVAFTITRSGAARTLTDGATTNLSTTVTSASGNFNNTDIGATITGTGIPASTTIASVTNPGTIVLSAAATATGSAVSLTITRSGGDWIGYNAPLGWQVIPAKQMATYYTATTN